METLVGIFDSLRYQLFDFGSRLALVYIGLTILLAVGVWLVRGRPGALLSWLFPAEVYRHKSNLLDIKLFLTYRVLSGFGIFSAVIFTPLVTFAALSWLVGLFPDAPVQPITFWRSVLATLLIVMAGDFVKYWAHRMHHEYKPLWSFHAVHHSADVLTPLTLSRAHPVESIIRNVGISILVGVTQAIALFTFIGDIDLVTIGGANAIYVAFNVAGSNLRHSHVWLSYGPVLEHVLISPAQHQVHHSMDVKHHNKNYGSIFAIWDWMFGTLYVPKNGPEDLRFGVADEHGVPLPQQYPTLKDALIKPFIESAAAFRERQTDGPPVDDHNTTSEARFAQERMPPRDTVSKKVNL
ncbi:MAG: sterol desaturase family protein [Paracoccaceae bacterium]